MVNNIPTNVSKIYIHTGNILNLNEVKKNAGQNSSEELQESIKIALETWAPPKITTDTVMEVHGNENSIQTTDIDPSELKASAKVFLTSGKRETLLEAVDKLFSSLNTDCIDSLVIACSASSESTNGPLKNLQELWNVLEEYVHSGKVNRIGISDIDTELFIHLYNAAVVKPSIIQINLSSCCVVPPALQEFTKQNDVQLLTHNDPIELLPRYAVNEIFRISEDESEGMKEDFQLHWAVRFQVHIKCRGVLATKGYIVCVQRI